MSWHSVAGSSFIYDFSFHRFEETNKSCTATDSAAEDRPLGPNMSDHEEEQLSVQSDTTSSRSCSKKRPREVSEKRFVSEASGMKHDAISKQHNEKGHHSFEGVVVKPGVPLWGPKWGILWGTLNKMQTIIFLKRLGRKFGEWEN